METGQHAPSPAEPQPAAEAEAAAAAPGAASESPPPPTPAAAPPLDPPPSGSGGVVVVMANAPSPLVGEAIGARSVITTTRAPMQRTLTQHGTIVTTPVPPSPQHLQHQTHQQGGSPEAQSYASSPGQPPPPPQYQSPAATPSHDRSPPDALAQQTQPFHYIQVAGVPEHSPATPQRQQHYSPPQYTPMGSSTPAPAPAATHYSPAPTPTSSAHYSPAPTPQHQAHYSPEHQQQLHHQAPQQVSGSPPNQSQSHQVYMSAGSSLAEQYANSPPPMLALGGAGIPRYAGATPSPHAPPATSAPPPPPHSRALQLAYADALRYSSPSQLLPPDDYHAQGHTMTPPPSAPSLTALHVYETTASGHTLKYEVQPGGAHIKYEVDPGTHGIKYEVDTAGHTIKYEVDASAAGEMATLQDLKTAEEALAAQTHQHQQHQAASGADLATTYTTLETVSMSSSSQGGVYSAYSDGGVASPYSQSILLPGGYAGFSKFSPPPGGAGGDLLYATPGAGAGAAKGLLGKADPTLTSAAKGGSQALLYGGAGAGAAAAMAYDPAGGSPGVSSQVRRIVRGGRGRRRVPGRLLDGRWRRRRQLAPHAGVRARGRGGGVRRRRGRRRGRGRQGGAGRRRHAVLPRRRLPAGRLWLGQRRARGLLRPIGGGAGRRGDQGVRQLRRQRDAAVAPRRHGPLPLQRLRPLQQDQRRQPPARALARQEDGLDRHQADGRVLRQLPHQQHHPVAPQQQRGARVQRLRPLLQAARDRASDVDEEGRHPDAQAEAQEPRHGHGGRGVVLAGRRQQGRQGRQPVPPLEPMPPRGQLGEQVLISVMVPGPREVLQHI